MAHTFLRAALMALTALAPLGPSAALAQATTTSGPQDLASLEANEAVVRRYYEEMVNGGDWSGAAEVIAEDLVQNNPGVAQGRDGVREEMEAFQGAFADFRIRLDEVVAEGDLVVVRATVSGTHSGDLLGMAATGNAIEFASMDFFRVTDGKLSEHWDVTDRLALLQQLGVEQVPPDP